MAVENSVENFFRVVFDDGTSVLVERGKLVLWNPGADFFSERDAELFDRAFDDGCTLVNPDAVRFIERA